MRGVSVDAVPPTRPLSGHEEGPNVSLKTLMAICVLVMGCTGEIDRGQGSNDGDVGTLNAPGPSSIGHDVYFTRTYGNEVFLTLVFPNVPGGFTLGIDQVLLTPRDVRFDEFGVLNDPDCTDGDASTDFLDKCDDPNSSGVIGLRKYPNPSFPNAGPKYLFGSACATCHAGFDAENPPADPNHPTWNNIDVMPGNAHLQIGKIFGGHLSTHDPRRQVFDSWAPGTVDTTAIWSDHIDNTLAIAPITDFDKWPEQERQYQGDLILTSAQEGSGQDDVGCELRSLRVWMSEGMCALECSLPAAAAGVPLDVDACRDNCAAFRLAESEVGEMCQFLRGWHPPRLGSAPGGDDLIDDDEADHGGDVFAANCAGCHDGKDGLYSDFQVRPVDDIGVNSCAARTTNWTAAGIWAQFSSDDYKARPGGGPGFIRTPRLHGVWASAPLLHSNELGPYTHDPSVEARVGDLEAAMHLLLNPAERDAVGSIRRTTDFIVLPGGTILPAGTPIFAFANADGQGGNLCADAIEIGGHTYGASLSSADKTALIEYLKTL